MAWLETDMDACRELENEFVMYFDACLPSMHSCSCDVALCLRVCAIFYFSRADCVWEGGAGWQIGW